MTDNWFTKLCYSAGKTIHEITKPAPGSKSSGSKRTVNKKVEEKKVSKNVTLRRTTIDEIEITNRDQEEADNKN
ncbi:MAG TPA: hypothetical protein DCM28_00715 [Phycisphaerales bacterium]|nr:hypothetical protein [Phycisphaerales bacterium]HCD31712.1 hypothetical protein [Phycisphaerales bacterium]|tara:strand:+ start:1604 stop:1825 length:222 start_codon:yes stop_codon:yes gene_type:complete